MVTTNNKIEKSIDDKTQQLQTIVDEKLTIDVINKNESVRQQ